MARSGEIDIQHPSVTSAETLGRLEALRKRNLALRCELEATETSLFTVVGQLAARIARWRRR